MAKSIRSIKADLCDDETLGACSRDARYLFVGLITRVDDHGRCRANPALLRSRIYPYDDDVTNADVTRWLGELSERGRIHLYTFDGQQYLVIRRWEKHQRIDNAAKSELPPPPEEVCGEPPQVAANLGGVEGSLARIAAGREGIGGEGIGGELPPQRAAANGQRKGTRLPDPWPLTPDLAAVGAEANPLVDVALEHAKFCDYWHAKAGRDATKLDWVATWRNWCRNARAAPNGHQPAEPRGFAGIREYQALTGDDT